MAEGEYVEGDPRVVEGPFGSTGTSLSDVVRDILWGVMEEQGWTQAQTAERLGITQSELNRFLHDRELVSGKRQELKTSALTSLCLVLGENPIELFSRHPLYAEGARDARGRARERLFERYKVVLRNVEVPALLGALEEAKERGVFEQCLSAVHNVVDAARSAGPRGGPKPARGRRRAG